MKKIIDAYKQEIYIKPSKVVAMRVRRVEEYTEISIFLENSGVLNVVCDKKDVDEIIKVLSEKNDI